MATIYTEFESLFMIFLLVHDSIVSQLGIPTIIQKLKIGLVAFLAERVKHRSMRLVVHGNGCAMEGEQPCRVKILVILFKFSL